MRRNGRYGRLAYDSVGAGSPSLSATWTVNSTGPITMGLIAPQGSLPSGYGVQVGSFTTQTDVLNTWPDGSIRHALVSFDATSTGAKVLTVILNPGGSYSPTWPSASVAFEVTSGPGSGSTYTATLPSFTSTNSTGNGAVMRRCWLVQRPQTGGGTNHDNLQVVWEVTSYAAGGHRIGVGIQNIRNVSTMDAVTANVTTTVNGSGVSALTKSGWTIYTGQRWYRTTTVSMSEAEVLHDFEPWIDANVIPRIVGADSKTYDTTTSYYALGNASGYFGEADVLQGNSENADRQELNPWTDWEARLFALNTETYRQVVLKNAQMSGAWCWQIDKDGDGTSILKITDGTNASDVTTDRVAGVGNFDGLSWPSYADGGGAYSSAWKGALDSGAVQVDREHLPELNFISYLLTGERWYLDQLRFQASWAVFVSGGGYSEASPNIWSGYSRGRHGSLGELNDAEMGRGFGRPLKMVARAAWAMPDAYSADQSYFRTIVSNNLDAVARYIDYIDSRSWGGSWATCVGMNPSETSASAYMRGNSVTSTTGASPTVLTVIGDDSGVGTGTDDHGMQTGDYVTLSGFSGGASGLNGRHAITRLSATTFSVAVNTTGSATSGVGSWETVRGLQTPPWRTTVAAREVSWIGFTGLWTMTSSMWAFPDRMARMEIAVQDNPSYSTAPGVSHNFYPSPCYVSGNNLVFYESWTDYKAANDPSLSTSYLFDSESVYTLYLSTTHRGNIQGWNPSNSNTYYTPYALVMYAHARRRGLSGAATAYTNVLAASGVLAEVMRRPGFYHGVP